MFRSSRIPRLLLAAAKNPYKILELDQTAGGEVGEKEIKKAHRALAMKYHPDNNQTGDAEKFKEVQAAFDTLKAHGWKMIPDGAQPAPGGGGGFDSNNNPSGAGHTWNPPGSTKENYVENNKRLQAMVRVVVMWCAFFALMRYILSMSFPDLQGRKAAADLMMKQMEEYEERKKNARWGKNHGSEPKSDEKKKMEQQDPMLQPQVQQLVGQFQNTFGMSPSTSTSTNIPIKEAQEQQKQDNNDEFVSWGDLGKNNSSGNNKWNQPKADHDPFAPRR